MLLGSRSFQLDRMVQDRLRRWHLCAAQVQAWQSMCEADAISLVEALSGLGKKGHTLGKLVRPRPHFAMGHLASGNVVVASEEFKKRLKQMDRKLIACAFGWCMSSWEGLVFASVWTRIEAAHDL